MANYLKDERLTLTIASARLDVTFVLRLIVTDLVINCFFMRDC